MRTLAAILLLALSHITLAQPQISAEANLESVTVYTRGVEMNHKAKITLPAGSSEVLIRNVANVLDESSVRIGANANVTILSVSFNKDYMKPKEKSRAYLQMEDSVKVLNKQLAAISNETQAEQSVLEVLERNGTIAGTNTSVSVAELEKMLDFYGKKQLETKKRLTALAEKEERCTQQIAQLQHQMQELTADKEDNRGQLVVQVMAKAAASSDFSISYVSPNAAWAAFYDLRAENTTQPLKLAYKANITQSTGIDWKKVKLVLATGSPSQNNTAPGLATWFLWFNSPVAFTGNNGGLGEVEIYGKAIDKRNYTGALVTVTAKDIARRPVTDIVQAIDGDAPGVHVSGGGQPGATPDVLMRGTGSQADGTKTLSSYTRPEDRELNATFNVDIPYDIASNAKPHSVSLQEYQVPSSYRYYATPKSSPDAFLTAEITGYEQLNLLPGTANIIFENMYIGKSALNPAVTTDTLNLSMGADRRIVIKREKVADQSSVKTIGSNRRKTFTYEIKVRNGKKETIDLLLKDQYPIATDKDMEVELLESSAAAVNTETGILSWDLKLAPGETKTLRLRYSVKYPKEKLLANL